MQQIFDIFSRLPDGSPIWLESVEGFAQALKRLNRLGRLRPGVYFLYSEATGGVLSQLPQSERQQGEEQPQIHACSVD